MSNAMSSSVPMLLDTPSTPEQRRHEYGLEVFQLRDDVSWEIDYEHEDPTVKVFKPTCHTLEQKIYADLLSIKALLEEDVEEMKKTAENLEKSIVVFREKLHAYRPSTGDCDPICMLVIAAYHQPREVRIIWFPLALDKKEQEKHRKILKKPRKQIFEVVDDEVKTERIMSLMRTRLQDMAIKNQALEEAKKHSEAVMNQQIAELRTQLGNIEIEAAHLNSMRTELEQVKNENQALREDKQQKELKIQEEFAQLRRNLEAEKTRSRDLEARKCASCSTWEDEYKKANSDFVAEKTNNEHLQKENTKLSTENQKLSAEVTQLNNELAQSRSQNEDLEARMASAKDDFQKVNSDFAVEKGKNEHLQSENTKLTTKNLNLLAGVTQLDNEITQSRRRIGDFEAGIAAANDYRLQNAGLLTANQGLQKEIETLKATVETEKRNFQMRLGQAALRVEDLDKKTKRLGSQNEGLKQRLFHHTQLQERTAASNSQLQTIVNGFMRPLQQPNFLRFNPFQGPQIPVPLMLPQREQVPFSFGPTSGPRVIVVPQVDPLPEDMEVDIEG